MAKRENNNRAVSGDANNELPDSGPSLRSLLPGMDGKLTLPYGNLGWKTDTQASVCYPEDMNTLGSEQLAKPDRAAPARSPEKSQKPSMAKKRPFRFLPSRELLSKVALELFIVFVGVSAAFALENFREGRAQDGKRQAVYRALDRELTQMAETHGPSFHAEIARELNAWDTALARGQKPVPPAFRISGAERPPTGVWRAAVATGSIELIDSELFYELARFYNRADSLGDLYQRYAEGAQTYVWPYLGEGPTAFWQPNGKLRPEVIASVQRLRDFQQRLGDLDREAQHVRAELRWASAQS